MLGLHGFRGVEHGGEGGLVHGFLDISFTVLPGGEGDLLPAPRVEAVGFIMEAVGTDGFLGAAAPPEGDAARPEEDGDFLIFLVEAEAVSRLQNQQTHVHLGAVIVFRRVNVGVIARAKEAARIQIGHRGSSLHEKLIECRERMAN